MSLRTKCPHCDREAVLVVEALGKSVRCKGCSKSYTARAAGKVPAEPELRAAVKAGAPTAMKTPPRPLAVRRNGDDRPPPGRREESKTTLWLGLGAIGLVTVLVSALEFVLIVNRHPQVLAHAPPPPPPAPPAKAHVVEPAPIAKAPPKEDPKREIELPPKEDPRPKVDPVVEPPPPPKFAEAPPGLYGDQGGEAILPGVEVLHTHMRARSDDSFYRIDNPHVIPNGANPRGAFLIHFKNVQRGKLTATHLLLRYSGKQVDLTGFAGFLEKDSGTLRINKDPNGTSQFPEDIECFLVRVDSTFGNPIGVFMVSNAVRIGDPGEPTRPRNWSPAEIARFTQEAPAGLRENAFPGVGVDTEFAGTSQGGISRRHVDPKGHLLGLEYRVGSWAGESCLGALRPIYNSNQSKLFPQSVLAKEGYAVSGAEAQYRNNVDALKLHFRRIKRDGSLDPSDSYESPWFGAPDPACRTITLGDTGPRVIGIFTRSGAVVDGMALVLDSK